MARFKNIYFILLFISVILFIIFRIPYRNYIYSNDLNDFFIADTAPNFFAVIMFVFLKKWEKRKWATTKNNFNFRLSVNSFFGACFYEYIIQIHIYDATIDHFDVIASLMAAVLVYFICDYIDGRELSPEIENS